MSNIISSFNDFVLYLTVIFSKRNYKNVNEIYLHFILRYIMKEF